MTSIFKTEKSISFRKSIRSEALSRVKASVLLVIFLFAAASQTVHYHAGIYENSVVSRAANNTKTPNASAVPQMGNQDECLICHLKRQASSLRVYHAPDVVLLLEVKPVRAAVFFSATHYRSAENSPTCARCPPSAPFLS